MVPGGSKRKDSKYRDYYVWTDNPPEEPEQQVVFRGEKGTVWKYDEEAGAYYRHRFYEHQPDLNIANPAVREEIGMGDDLSLPERDSVRTPM